MARRLTKEEKALLEQQQFQAALEAWASGGDAMLSRHSGMDMSEEEFQAAARGLPADSPFLNVQSGASSVAANPFSGPAFNRPRDRQEGSGLLGDSIIGAASTAADILASGVDMLAPDPNALAEDTSNPFQNALENIVDTGLRIPVQLDDGVRGVFRRLSPSASPEAIDAVMRTINPYAAKARDIVNSRTAEAEARVLSGEADLTRSGAVNELADSIRGISGTMREARTPEAIAAERGLGEAVDSGIVDTAKFLASGQGVRALAQTAAGSAPYAALGFGAGRAFSALGASPAAATAGSGSVMFSNIATSNASQVEQAIMDLSPEEAASNPVLADLLGRGMSLEEAKRTAASQARFETIASMVPTAPMYTMGVFERMGAGQSIRQSTLDTLQRAAVRGTVREAGQEFVQESSERLASNVGEIAAGLRSEDDRYQGVTASGVVGAAVGGPLGGGGAAAQASTDFQSREQLLNALADRLEQRAAERAAAREELEQAQFEEQAMERLAAQDAQREFLRQPGQPVGQNAGRPVESFEQYAEREGADVIAAEQAQADFLSMDTAPASDQALDNSLREGPRWSGMDTPLTGTRAQRRAENERLASSVIQEQAELDSDMEAFEQAREQRLAQEAELESQTEEARQFDRAQSAQDLKSAKSRHAAARKAALRDVQRANANKPEAERLEAIRQAAVEWDIANPAPTAQQAAADAQQGAPRRRGGVGRTAVPAAPQLDADTLRAAGMTEEEIAQQQTESTDAPTDVADRIEALRNRTGAGRRMAGEAADGSRSPAEVVRAIATRVGRGTDRRALAQEQLLLNGKLSVVSDEDMTKLAGGQSNGFYDGERMYINAGVVPAGNEAATILDLILTHEADHAARASGNADAASKVRMLLGDGATDRLVQRLETDSHPIAQDARNSVEQLGLDESPNRAMYEDELIAYAITSAVRRGAQGGVWAPIRGVVSAARRKWKDYTGSEDINLDDLAAYAQQTVDALAESRGDISAETEGRQMIVGPNSREWDSAINKFRGYIDGKERGEISDALAEVVSDGDSLGQLLSGEKFNLDEVLDHEGLFNNYPQLRTRSVSVTDTKGITGVFDGRNFQVSRDLVEQSMSDPTAREELRRTILHEIQHAIQDIEGFVGGSNPDYYIPRKIKDEYALSSERFDSAVINFPLERAVQSLDDDVKRDWFSAANAWREFNPNVDVTTDSGRRAITLLFLNEGWGERSGNQLIRAAQNAYDERKARLAPARAAYNEAYRAGLSRYLRVYGEAEARNTEARSRMTEEDLAVLYPERTMGVDESNVIVEETTDNRGRTRDEIAGQSLFETVEPRFSGRAARAIDLNERRSQRERTEQLRRNVAAWGTNAPRAASFDADAANAPVANTPYTGGNIPQNSVVVFTNRNSEGGRAVGTVVASSGDSGPTRFVVEFERDGITRTRQVGESEIIEVVNTEASDVRPFGGRAMRLSVTEDVTADGQRRIRDAIRDKTPNVILDAISVYGSGGEGLFDMNQDLENARNSIYQSALAFDARLSKAFADAAKSRGVSVEELNNTVLKRLEAIGKIPNNTRKDNLIARIVQDYPELHALPEAIQNINAQTDRIINARLADPRPITEEELAQLEYMEANKYSYLTNVYAAFQGKAGKEFRKKLMEKHSIGYKAVLDGKAVPEAVKREYAVYERALSFITANDVAVSDPEMLAALPIEQVRGLYDMWTTLGDSAESVQVDMENNGTYNVDEYRDILESRIAGWVEEADATTIRNMAGIVLNNLLDNHPLSGPAKRYGRGAGLDESILQHRSDLPPELADLYGKITDIPSLINATLVRQGELAEKMKFLTRLATETNERGRPYVVSQREAASTEFGDYTVPLSGESFGPLSGMMTTPETARMITDYSEGMTMLTDALAIAGQEPSVLRRAASSKLVELWAKGAGAQKAMKIITRPDYLLLNFAGSFSTPVLTGGFTPQDFLKGVQLSAEHLSYTLNPSRDKEVSPELRLVLEMGLFDNAVTQEIRNTPRKMVEQVIRQMGSVGSMSDFHSLLSDTTGGARRAWNLAVEAYSMSDAWAKIPVGLARMRYLQDYYKANGDDVSNEQIVREAAKFVRDSTIGMQAVPAGLKGLERLGMTFYLPYFYSAFRTLARAPINAWNDAKMAVDAKTPEARSVAARSAALKTAGTAMVYWGLTSVLKNFLEDMMDDDEREQLDRDRNLMFPQDAVGDLFPVGEDELGRRMYFVASRIDQFGPATDIFRALRENDDPDKALGIVAEGLRELFLANRALGWAIDTAKDKDRNTQTERVFAETTDWMKSQAAQLAGNKGVQTVDAFIDAVDLFMPAGLMNYVDPENKNPQDVDGQGRALVAGLMAALGHRFVIIDEGRSLGVAAGELRGHRTDARRNISNTLSSLGPQAAMQELLTAASRERELVENVGKMFQAVVESGTSPREAMQMLKDSGMDAATIAAIRKQAYTTEAESWAKNYSSILSPSSLRNPPRPRESMTPEQRKEWQREWRSQAAEVMRRMRTKSYYETEDGDE